MDIDMGYQKPTTHVLFLKLVCFPMTWYGHPSDLWIPMMRWPKENHLRPAEMGMATTATCRIQQGAGLENDPKWWNQRSAVGPDFFLKKCPSESESQDLVDIDPLPGGTSGFRDCKNACISIYIYYTHTGIYDTWWPMKYIPYIYNILLHLDVFHWRSTDIGPGHRYSTVPWQQICREPQWIRSWPSFWKKSCSNWWTGCHYDQQFVKEIHGISKIQILESFQSKIQLSDYPISVWNDYSW